MKQVREVTPAKAAEDEADGEGSQHSSHREDGHRERPQGGEGALRDGLGKPAAPRLIVETLDDLKQTQQTAPLQGEAGSPQQEIHPRA